MLMEPIRINIPENEIPKFKVLAHVGNEFLQSILSTLDNVKPNIDNEELSKTISKKSSLEYNKTNKILQILWLLSFLQRKVGLNTEDFLESITYSLDKYNHGWKKEDTIAWKEKAPFIISLLSSDGIISIGSKAGELILEQGLIFQNSRIVTDLRPIYSENAETINGYVPFHTIVFNVFEDGEQKGIHLALDSNDIIQLRQQLERAEKKENVLRNQLTTAGIVVIQTKANDL